MKRIEGFVQPHRLSKVVSALHALPHFPGFTIMNAQGQGHGRGQGGSFVYSRDAGLLLHPRLVLVVYCEDHEAHDIAMTIARIAHTGNKGDGIVAITEASEVIRIRSVEPTSSPTTNGDGDDA